MLPIQPLHIDEHGTTRFRKNKVVDCLLTYGGLDLNQLHLLISAEEYREDWEQFAQLIGYSVSGFGELSYVSDEAYELAEAEATKLRPQEKV